MSGLCDDDRSFGPASACRDTDFTLPFQDIVFSLVPNLIFLAVGSLEAWSYRRQPRLSLPFGQQSATGRTLSLVKPLVVCAFLGLQIACIAIWPTGHWTATAAWASAIAATSFAASLIHLSHHRALQGSTTVALWLLATIAGDIVRTRTAWTIWSLTASHLLTALLGLRVALLAVVSLSTRDILKPSVRSEQGLDSTSSFVSRSFVAWLNPLFLLGWRRPLKLADMPVTPPSHRPDALWAKFEAHWDPHGKRPLARTVYRSLRAELLLPVLPAAFTGAMLGLQPLLVYALVNFLRDWKSVAERPSSTYGFVIATGFLVLQAAYAFGSSLTRSTTIKSAGALRGALVSAIYDHTLLVKSEVAIEAGAGVAASLMSVDVERVCDWGIVMSYTAFFQLPTLLLTSLWALWLVSSNVVLIAAVVHLSICAAVMPLSAHGLDARQQVWSAATDVRVKLISSVVRSLQYVKMAALEPVVVKMVGQAREHELGRRPYKQHQARLVVILANWVGELLMTISIVVYFAEQRIKGQAPQAGTVFALFSVGGAIAWPLSGAGQQIARTLSALASFHRIEVRPFVFERVAHRARTYLLAEEHSLSVSSRESIAEKKTEVDDRLPSLERATLAYTEHAILHDIEFRPVAHGLTMICGSVGSGKSAILLGLLNEQRVIDGAVSSHGTSVAFAAQEPWLQSALTVRQNICLEDDDPARLDRVLRATCLDEDMRSWSTGLDRKAGGLSGGQVQRIALARAIYSERAQLILLDDVLSAVDAIVERRVWSALFGSNGLLRGRSVVLVTSAIHHVIDADLAVFVEDGRIVQRGVGRELVEKDGPIRELFEMFQRKAETEPVLEKVEDTSTVAQKRSQSPASSEDEVDREVANAEVPGSSVLEFLRACHPIHASLGYSLQALVGFIVPGLLIYSAWWLARDDSAAIRYIVGLALIDLSWPILASYCLMSCWIWATVPAMRRLHARALHGLLCAPTAVQASFTVGTLLSRFAQDDQAGLSQDMVQSMQNMAYRIGELIARGALIGINSPPLLGLLAGVLIAVERTQRFYLATSRRLRQLALATKSDLYSNFADTIQVTGLRTIRAAGWQQLMRDRNANIAAISQSPWLLEQIASAWWELVVGMISAILIAVIAFLAVATRGSGSATVAGAALTAGLAIGPTAGHLIENLVRLQLSTASLQRICELIHLAPEQSDSVDEALELKSGSIRFDDVTFAYSPDDDPAVAHLSLDVADGERIGICGRTGSGKSTLLSLLFAMHEPQSGSISVDGKPIGSMRKTALRDALSIVPQDPTMLSTSLRANLDPASEHDDATTWRTLEAVSCADVVRKLSDQLETPIDASAAQFSRGERQLLALATCALRRRRIVALDESTSSVDLESERAIQHALKTAFGDATLIVVAHRISTILDMDRVVVMGNGRILEVGPPRELLQRPDGHFRALAGSLAHVEAS